MWTERNNLSKSSAERCESLPLRIPFGAVLHCKHRLPWPTQNISKQSQGNLAHNISKQSRGNLAHKVQHLRRRHEPLYFPLPRGDGGRNQSYTDELYVAEHLSRALFTAVSLSLLLLMTTMSCGGSDWLLVRPAIPLARARKLQPMALRRRVSGKFEECEKWKLVRDVLKKSLRPCL